MRRTAGKLVITYVQHILNAPHQTGMNRFLCKPAVAGYLVHEDGYPSYY